MRIEIVKLREYEIVIKLKIYGCRYESLNDLGPCAVFKNV